SIEGGLNAQRARFQPLFIGLAGFEQVVHILGIVQGAGQGIDRHNLAWAKATLGNYVRWVVVVYTHLRGHGDDVIFGDYPARWTQAIAVKGTYRVAAIGQHQASWAIPWLYVHRVVFVEGAQIRV